MTFNAIHFQPQNRICDFHCENNDKNVKMMKNAIYFAHTFLINEAHITVSYF